MKVSVLLFAILGLTSAAVVPHFQSQDEKFEIIKKQAADFYKTLPKELEEDAILETPEMVQKYGYPCERHSITTADGYILEIHRIPHGKDGPSENRSAVYIQHGIMMSSGDWVVPGPGKGLAYVLADAGYDVWMLNARGTRYSRKHVELDPDENAKTFWDFSWHEIGIYDLPTMIDYVIDQTKQEKIFYIGHSQGTTVFYVMGSQLPEYNNKIRAMFSLAPSAYMKWMTSPILRTISLFEWGLSALGDLIGIYEFLPNSELKATIGDVLCGDDSIMQVLCTNSLFALCGFNKDQMNATLLPVIMGHTPAGASTKQVYHFSQEVNSGKFQQFDYGMFGNLNKYGSISAPNYKLSKVTAPVYLHYSRNDWLSNEIDVLKLYDQLGNVQAKLLVPDSKWNHLDYCYGIDAPTLVYNRVISLMKRH